MKKGETESETETVTARKREDVSYLFAIRSKKK
jgi:hypothetical protein